MVAIFWFVLFHPPGPFPVYLPAGPGPPFLFPYPVQQGVSHGLDLILGFPAEVALVVLFRAGPAPLLVVEHSLPDDVGPGFPGISVPPGALLVLLLKLAVLNHPQDVFCQ